MMDLQRLEEACRHFFSAMKIMLLLRDHGVEKKSSICCVGLWFPSFASDVGCQPYLCSIPNRAPLGIHFQWLLGMGVGRVLALATGLPSH